MIFENKIKDAFKKNFLVRYDDTGLVHYFTYKDFEGLSHEEFTFVGNRGQRLVGNIYWYGEMSRERLIVFDHGMGGGHTAYMKEIVELAKRGFTVLSYDHTGCMASEGENISAISQSLADLDYCIRAIKEDARFSSCSVSVVGHSWGAFSTLNVSAIHKDITHIVAMSGFISVKDMLRQFLPGPFSLYAPAVYKMELTALPEYAEFSAIESLKNSSAKAMIIHSVDDATCSFKRHFVKLKNALSDRPNTSFVALTGKKHNPNFTVSAVGIKDAFFEDLTKKTKAGYFTSDEKKEEFKSGYDFDKMSEQDGALWNDIATFLKS